MGTILASTILGQVSKDLNDPSQVRWPAADLLRYLNDGQRAAAGLKPECSRAPKVWQLTAGVAQQALPVGVLRLVEPVCNQGADGVTPGMPITLAERSTLDGTQPTWRTDVNAMGYVRHVILTSDPHTVNVYPKAPSGAWQIEAICDVVPADVTASTNPITLDDIYEEALTWYVMHRCYGKNVEFGGSTGESNNYYQKFMAAMAVSLSTAGAAQ